MADEYTQYLSRRMLRRAGVRRSGRWCPQSSGSAPAGGFSPITAQFATVAKQSRLWGSLCGDSGMK